MPVRRMMRCTQPGAWHTFRGARCSAPGVWHTRQGGKWTGRQGGMYCRQYHTLSPCLPVQLARVARRLVVHTGKAACQLTGQAVRRLCCMADVEEPFVGRGPWGWGAVGPLSVATLALLPGAEGCARMAPTTEAMPTTTTSTNAPSHALADLVGFVADASKPGCALAFTSAAACRAYARRSYKNGGSYCYTYSIDRTCTTTIRNGVRG